MEAVVQLIIFGYNKKNRSVINYVGFSLTSPARAFFGLPPLISSIERFRVLLACWDVLLSPGFRFTKAERSVAFLVAVSSRDCLSESDSPMICPSIPLIIFPS